MWYMVGGDKKLYIKSKFTFRMVEFGTGGYMHPMDRSYGDSSPVDNTTSDVGIGIKDIGFSTGLGPTPNINAVSAKMRTGQKKMELTFMGAGKGNQQGQTPGMFGKRQRQALLPTQVWVLWA
jgi:hypothetical protein